MPNVKEYLDQAHLKRLNLYAYSGVDKSPISRYVMNPYWTFAASFMPPTLAPNLITLIGFAAIAVNFASVLIFIPDLTGPGPAWVYLTCAVGLFFYQTMDNIDGKQARKTGTSSPLGELFDHGLDTLNCPLTGLIQAAAFGLGHSGFALLFVFVNCWSMYLSTWEEYHTHTLFLGVVNGPVEGILAGVLVLLLSGFYGPGIWLTEIELAVWPRPVALGHLLVIGFFLAFCTLHAPICIYNACEAVKRTSRRKSVDSRLMALQLAPLALFSAGTFAWALSPYSSILSDGHLPAVTLLVCFLFGQMSSKIIVAHLTRGRFPLDFTLSIPVLIPAVIVNMPFVHVSPHTERVYIYIALVLSIMSYSIAVSRVLTAFCGFLGIRCLTISPTSQNTRKLTGVKPRHIEIIEEEDLSDEQGGRKRSNTSEREAGLSDRKTAYI